MKRRSKKSLCAVVIVESAIAAALSAGASQTAWIYLKRKDGTIQRKVPTNIPTGAAIQYVKTALMSRDAEGTMQDLVAWVPFVPILTLSPRDFPALPEPVKQQLERIGCRIPQLSPSEPGQPKHVNVIQGEFARPGQKDWAVLCATGTKIAVHVFWSRPSDCPSEFASNELPELLDRKAFADSLSVDEILSGRVATGEWPNVIMRVGRAELTGYGPPPPPPMDYEAIEYAWWGKGSTVFYCSEGRWQEIASGD